MKFTALMLLVVSATAEESYVAGDKGGCDIQADKDTWDAALVGVTGNFPRPVVPSGEEEKCDADRCAGCNKEEKLAYEKCIAVAIGLTDRCAGCVAAQRFIYTCADDPMNCCFELKKADSGDDKATSGGANVFPSAIFAAALSVVFFA